MDADCLIKLTKAGLKELVCEAWSVSIPALVLEETAVDLQHDRTLMRTRKPCYY